MNGITPCLWFDGQAEEAVDFYVSIFEDAEVLSVTHYGKAASEAAGQPEGSVLTVVFKLLGQEFMALNGGPAFKFTPAISLMVACDTQEEIDRLWEALTEGGEPGQCSWLTDRYGVSWQIVPAFLGEMLAEGDAEKFERYMQAMLKMTKLDAAALRRAYDGV